MKKFIKIFSITVVLVLITTLNVFAQRSSWDFGRHRLEIGQSTGFLTETLKLGSGSYDFVTRVGGIAFEAVANPEESLKDQKIALSYDKSQSDGHRLTVSILGQVYRPFLPDWELIPIAKYADDSKNNAVVSLFGPGYEPKKNKYDIQYHQALHNTLLGMRLLQADIVFMDLGEFWQLPKLNQETILGYGENQNSVSREDLLVAAQEIQAILNSEKYQSWVYTDKGLNIKFSVKDNDLQLNNTPYYYFWKTDKQAIERQISEYKKQMGEYKRQVNEYKKQMEEYKKQGNEYERQMAQYKKQAESLRKQGLVREQNEIVQKHNEIARKLDKVIQKHNEIAKKAENLLPNVIELTTLNENMRAKNSVMYKYNPPVYNAAIQTMRFSAFFRYVKANNSGSWHKFLKDVKTIQTTPSVQTPTQWYGTADNSR
jgi:hypothetical protein